MFQTMIHSTDFSLSASVWGLHLVMKQ